MKKRSFSSGLLNLFAGVFCLTAVSGCSSVVNSHTQKEEMMQQYLNGQNDWVMAKIQERLTPGEEYGIFEKWKSVVGSGDEVMWRLEAGSMNFNLARYQESVDQLKKAEELIAGFDERADVNVRDAAEESGAALTNLNILPYRGLCRDRIGISIYKSLAYLGMGKEDSFRAQLHRLRDDQKKVQEDYQKVFEAEQKEIQETREKNPDEAKKMDEAAPEKSMENSPDNPEFTAGMEDVKKTANRGYGNFLNPAALFLSGLGLIRDNNYENARIDFQRIYEAMPQNPLARQYYVTVLRETGREVPAGLEKVPSFDFPLHQDCVYVLFANGRSAALKQIAVYFPIMAAWPMCEFYPAPGKALNVTADGKTHTTAMLADMDGIMAQEFQERLPGIITRIVLGTIIKEGAYYGGLAAIAVADMDPVAKVIVFTAVAIGGAIYRSSMNTADTRSWEILPKEFQLTQFPMPKDRRLTLENGAGTQEIRIPDDCRSAIVFVNAPSARVFQCQVLPIRSK